MRQLLSKVIGGGQVSGRSSPRTLLGRRRCALSPKSNLKRLEALLNNPHQQPLLKMLLGIVQHRRIRTLINPNGERPGRLGCKTDVTEPHQCDSREATTGAQAMTIYLDVQRVLAPDGYAGSISRTDVFAFLRRIGLLGYPAYGEDAKATISFRSQHRLLICSTIVWPAMVKSRGGYRVIAYEELIKAGDSGELPIATSAHHQSELLRRLICEDESERMPAESEPLAPERHLRRSTSGSPAVASLMVKTQQRLALVIPPVHRRLAP